MFPTTNKINLLNFNKFTNNDYMNKQVKGYIAAIVAAATYGMNPLFALPLYQGGMDTFSVLFFRYLVALPIICIMLHVRGRGINIGGKNILLSLVMGLLMATSSISLFASYLYMDAGIASTLLFIYPVIVALIMALFFKERITLQLALCIILTLMGIGLLYKGGAGVTLDTTGILLVMLSSLTYAIYIVAINKSNLRNIATLQVTFYVLLIGIVVFFIGTGCGRNITLPSQWWHWLCVISLAIFPTVISFLCTTVAIQNIGSTPTAILGALEPVTALIFGVTLFGEILTTRDLLGIILIIVAVTMVVAGSHITRPLTHIRKLFPRIKRH